MCLHLLTRFFGRRRELTTKEGWEREMEKVEQSMEATRSWQLRAETLRTTLLVFVVAYSAALCVAVYALRHWAPAWVPHLLRHSWAVVLVPLLAFAWRWWLASRAHSYVSKLARLAEQKRKLLAEVQEKLPYNDVMQLLEKYDPHNRNMTKSPFHKELVRMKQLCDDAVAVLDVILSVELPPGARSIVANQLRPVQQHIHRLQPVLRLHRQRSAQGRRRWDEKLARALGAGAQASTIEHVVQEDLMPGLAEEHDEAARTGAAPGTPTDMATPARRGSGGSGMPAAAAAAAAVPATSAAAAAAGDAHTSATAAAGARAAQPPAPDTASTVKRRVQFPGSAGDREGRSDGETKSPTAEEAAGDAQAAAAEEVEAEAALEQEGSAAGGVRQRRGGQRGGK